MYTLEAKKFEFLVHLDRFSKFLKNSDFFPPEAYTLHNSLPSFWAKLGYSRIKIDLLSLCFTNSSLKLKWIFYILNFCNSLLRLRAFEEQMPYQKY